MSRDKKRERAIHIAALPGVFSKKYHKKFLFCDFDLYAAVTHDGFNPLKGHLGTAAVP